MFWAEPACAERSGSGEASGASLAGATVMETTAVLSAPSASRRR